MVADKHVLQSAVGLGDHQPIPRQMASKQTKFIHLLVDPLPLQFIGALLIQTEPVVIDLKLLHRGFEGEHALMHSVSIQIVHQFGGRGMNQFVLNGLQFGKIGNTDFPMDIVMIQSAESVHVDQRGQTKEVEAV